MTLESDSTAPVHRLGVSLIPDRLTSDDVRPLYAELMSMLNPRINAM